MSEMTASGRAVILRYIYVSLNLFSMLDRAQGKAFLFLDQEKTSGNPYPGWYSHVVRLPAGSELAPDMLMNSCSLKFSYF